LYTNLEIPQKLFFRSGSAAHIDRSFSSSRSSGFEFEFKSVFYGPFERNEASVETREFASTVEFKTPFWDAFLERSGTRVLKIRRLKNVPFFKPPSLEDRQTCRPLTLSDFVLREGAAQGESVGWRSASRLPTSGSGALAGTCAFKRRIS